MNSQLRMQIEKTGHFVRVKNDQEYVITTIENLIKIRAEEKTIIL